MAAMMNQALFAPQMKDSRWLTLEVCREFTRQKCTRTETECKFAHPPPHVEVQNGRVTCCFDSIKGKCQRKDPPCKYLHPPQHLREQLLQNGRNNLIMRNLQMTAIAQGVMPPTVIPQHYLQGAPQQQQQQQQQPQTNEINGMNAVPMSELQWMEMSRYGSLLGEGWKTLPNSASAASAGMPGQFQMMAHPYLSMQQNPPTAAALNPYSQLMQPATAAATMQMTPAAVPTLETNGVASTQAVPVLSSPQPVSTTPKLPRPVDRLEPSTTSSSSSTSLSGSTESQWATYPDTVVPTSQYSPVYFQPQVVEVLPGHHAKKRPRDPADDFILSMPGMVPMMKRQAMGMDGSKGGFSMMQPAATPQMYQHALAAMQMQQQAYCPVTIAGQPPGMPRF